MKKLVYILMLIALVFPAMSQDKEEPEEQTLAGGGKTVITGYGAPELLFSRFRKSEFALLMGGRGGIIINHHFIIGGGGYGIVTRHSIQYKIGETLISDTRLMFGYGGLHLGYVFKPASLVHVTLGALIGGGGAGTYRGHDGMGGYDWDNGMLENSGVFVFQPSVGGELNITKWFRTEITAGYRLVSGSNLTKISDSDLSCFYFGLALKFGKF